MWEGAQDGAVDEQDAAGEEVDCGGGDGIRYGILAPRDASGERARVVGRCAGQCLDRHHALDAA